MVWKCPYCEKDLQEEDVTRGNCPYCYHLFDIPTESEPETLKPPEEIRPSPKGLGLSWIHSDIAHFWMLVGALGLSLCWLFLDFHQAFQKQKIVSSSFQTMVPSGAETSTKEKERNPEVEAILQKETEVAGNILREYGRSTYEEINEVLKWAKAEEQKDLARFGSLTGNPVGLAHAQLQLVYKTYSYAYLLISDLPEKRCGFKIISNDVQLAEKNYAEGKLAIKPIPPETLDVESTKLFNAVHSEPYEFQISYTKQDGEWKVKDWTMVGKKWNFRPLSP